MTSTGVMLLARRSNPFSPFRRALTTSLTPRLSWRTLDARLTVRKSFLESFLPARGEAMGEMASRGTWNSDWRVSAMARRHGGSDGAVQTPFLQTFLLTTRPLFHPSCPLPFLSSRSLSSSPSIVIPSVSPLPVSELGSPSLLFLPIALLWTCIICSSPLHRFACIDPTLKLHPEPPHSPSPPPQSPPHRHSSSSPSCPSWPSSPPSPRQPPSTPPRRSRCPRQVGSRRA